MKNRGTLLQNGNQNESWFIDRDSDDRWICHRVRKHILSARTRYQLVEIFDTSLFGRMVVLDDSIQSSEKDEYIYHEALVHPAMLAHPDPQDILILGGGEGATLREVLRHPPVRTVCMVDIDREFVAICRNHLRNWHKGSFRDPRVTLQYSDAFEYLKNTKDRFDVVIADISDPNQSGPAKAAYTRKFYSLIRKALLPDGIFVTQATAFHYVPQRNTSGRIVKTLRGIFPEVSCYYEYIPCFGTLWSFAVGSLKYSPGKLSVRNVSGRLRERRLDTLLYYDAEIHDRLFGMSAPAGKLRGNG